MTAWVKNDWPALSAAGRNGFPAAEPRLAPARGSFTEEADWNLARPLDDAPPDARALAQENAQLRRLLADVLVDNAGLKRRLALYEASSR